MNLGKHYGSHHGSGVIPVLPAASRRVALRLTLVLALGYRFGRRTSVSAGLHLMDFNFSEPEGDAGPPADAGERALVLMLRGR